MKMYVKKVNYGTNSQIVLMPYDMVVDRIGKRRPINRFKELINERVFESKNIELKSYMSKKLKVKLNAEKEIYSNLEYKKYKTMNNLYATKASFIKRALLNFSNVEKLTFLTLTFRENITDIQYAKLEFKRFIQRLKRSGYLNFKYTYVIEWQKRGAIHFHCLFDIYFKNLDIVKNWNSKVDGSNKNVKVKGKNGYYYTILYLAKYFTKLFIIEREIGFKLYQFSQNCLNVSRETLIVDNEVIDYETIVLNSQFYKSIGGSGVSKFVLEQEDNSLFFISFLKK